MYRAQSPVLGMARARSPHFAADRAQSPVLGTARARSPPFAADRAQSPREVARSRYAQAFTSSIFEPAPMPQGKVSVPAGKRPDQTTAEMFGTYSDKKDLRAMPKTFMPRNDGITAVKRKQQAMHSEVLPVSSTYDAAPQVAEEVDSFGRTALGEELADTNARRHMQLSSNLFGRKTPELTLEHACESRRLTPNDARWFHPLELHRLPAAGEQAPRIDDMSLSERAYQQKCSTVFDHASPNFPAERLEAARQARQAELESQRRRRSNPGYSDLFGRTTPSWEVRPGRSGGASAEDRIAIQQDWTDSKTELLKDRPNSAGWERPAQRLTKELHHGNIFGASREREVLSENVQPVEEDNSTKLKVAWGSSTQQIHQAHLRSSLAPEAFYEEATSARHWQVVELHVSGLPRTACEEQVRNLCQGVELQIVKVLVEMDPVHHFCKGHAKVVVRFNPQRDSIERLVKKLEASHLRVEL